MSNPWIPVSEPLISAQDRARVADVLADGHIASGDCVQQFQERWAHQVHRNHGIAVSSGSMALEIAFDALGLEPGDEVILPAMTIISCMAPLVRRGVKPVLVDHDPHTWNMDVEQIEAKVSERTRAILAVHLYGLPVNLRPLFAIARRHNLAVIEDAAQMHGQTCDDLPCGSFGDLSIFSFYANKLITTGEGGMVMTDDAHLALHCSRAANLGFGIGPRRFVHRQLGWNARLSNLQAALGLSQLDSLSERVALKRAMGAHYTQLLAGVSELQLPLARTEWAENIYWMYGVVLKDHAPMNARAIMEDLAALGVDSRPFFHPLHQQPALARLGLLRSEHYPVAETLSESGFYLPSGLTLTPEQRVRVASALKQVLSR